MAKQWWILPVVLGGLTIWAYGGWIVYGALQGWLGDEPKAEVGATEPSQVANSADWPSFSAQPATTSR